MTRSRSIQERPASATTPERIAVAAAPADELDIAAVVMVAGPSRPIRSLTGSLAWLR